MFRDGTIVSPSHMSKGYYKKLMEFAINEELPDYLVTRTQNPRIYETFKNFVEGKIYPDFSGSTPVEIYKIACSFSPRYKVDENYLVVKDVYTNSKFPAPYHTAKDKNILKKFKSVLGNNDAIMIVAVM